MTDRSLWTTWTVWPVADIRLSELIAAPFYQVHRDIRQGGHSEYWLKGGRGSAKSSFVSIEIPFGMMRDPEANAIVYRKVAATLRESVYTQIEWAIDKLGSTGYFMFRKSPLEIIYKPTGQKIMFRGADDPGKSKSIKLAKGYFKYLWFEEPTEFSDIDELRTIKASVIRGGGRAITLLSYNPPISARNWVNEAAREGAEGRLTHHSSYLDVPAEWLGERFLGDAEALRATNERAYRHMYLGEVTGTGGSVFENVVTRVVTDAEIRTFGATYAGLDHGWYPDPLHFVRCAYSPATRTLIVYDEWRAWKQTSENMFRHLIGAKGVTYTEEIIADSGGAQSKSNGDLRAYGLNVVDASKGPGTVDMRIKWLQGLREIVIDPVRCPYAAKEFLEYEYERTRNGEIVAAYPDRDNHAIDAVGYALNRVWLTRGA
jgi:phage terminase large subunit